MKNSPTTRSAAEKGCLGGEKKQKKKSQPTFNQSLKAKKNE